ncbi:hypothetical protein J4433_00470 [Candidatus Pacearchaeota archaeon]|nr:hypothetical protein [Candidatus Pacearchaeota archaeon]
MTPIEILALIFAIGILVKIIAVLVNPKSNLKLAEMMLEGTGVLRIIYLILLAITGYYLLLELNIIQISAVMLFALILVALAFIPYNKHVLEIRREHAKSRKKFLKQNWLQLVIGAAIAIWTLVAILA